MLKNVGLLFGYTIFFFILSVILAGDFSSNTIVLCGIISCITAFIALFAIKIPTHIEIHYLKLLRYLVVVFISIYCSTYSTLRFFLKKKGKIPTDIETMPLKTKSGFSRLLICQAITLTPGTVSVTSKAGSVTILKIKPESLQGSKKFDNVLREKND